MSSLFLFLFYFYAEQLPSVKIMAANTDETDNNWSCSIREFVNKLTPVTAIIRNMEIIWPVNNGLIIL